MAGSCVMLGSRLSVLLRMVVAVVLLAVLSACETLDLSNRAFSSFRQVAWLENASSGSRYHRYLLGSDKREIDKAAWIAAESPTAHTEVTWSNPDTGSSGSVRPGVVYLVGFNAGAEIEAPVGLDTSVLLEPAAGDYTTNANANVRLAPVFDGERVTLLRRGNRVKVIAHEPAQGWYLVTSGGRVIGYVFASLLDKSDGGDLLLAGGDIQYPRLCRELTYKMEYSSGAMDEWLNGTCREKTGRWSIVGGRTLEAVG